MPVQLLAHHPGSSPGAAWLAGIGTGAVSDWAGVNRFITSGPLVLPNPQQRAFYEERFVHYRELYERLRPLFRKMAKETES